MDVDGLTLTAEDRSLLAHPSVGGIILFSRNFESREQLVDLVAEIRQVRSDLLIAVDQEGGRVQRFKNGFTRLPPLAEIGRLYQHEPQLALGLAKNTGWLLAAELLACGIDFSFAPVVDVDRGISHVIGDRSFGDQADVVSALGASMMEGMQEAGMATTLKHFPGHGAIQADSHVAIPVDERPYDTIAEVDLVPFQRLLATSQAVMPAHVIYSSCDESPAGFSAFWLQGKLRDTFGFSGVIFSDDLTMEGASVAGGFAQRVERALSAGCTMVLVCNHREGVKSALVWLAEHRPEACQAAEVMRAKAHLQWDELTEKRRWSDTRRQLQQLLAEQRVG